MMSPRFTVDEAWYAIRGVALLGAIVCALVAIAQTRMHAGKKDQFHVAIGLVPAHMNEDGTGREAEYLMRLLARDPNGTAHQNGARELVFHVQPFTRQWNSFLTESRFDAVATVSADTFQEDEHVFVSRSYIQYYNGLGYSARAFPNGLTFANMDARALRVAAFAGAVEIVKGLREKIGRFGSYLEVKDQLVQSRLLYEGRVDVVIEDELVFRCYGERIDPAWASSLRFTRFGEATPYKIAFRRREDRDIFNENLQSVSLADLEAKYDTSKWCSNVY